ncbi:uncharacterized protein SPAPADRAFT_48754 [Spathaspora passalidarum NRRL Y-27907]|uniref:PH domain-containing protein n=1 Tax=Spathaspora passalidarum (strain NRRL Y-27907 / 11-Y1) TaxID=619300 RepID=G3AEW3_SPAPN|nr:uncharacterized protein SPAPADRAFT_48754 [Spathaspora passalidarum NRRL Y-27907]EGW35793.1 hypothetical protein SPAPADRAFT_48754 [Spathaspora passalidarum NRRL Y-27907]
MSKEPHPTAFNASFMPTTNQSRHLETTPPSLTKVNWKSFTSTPIKDPFTGEIYLTDIQSGTGSKEIPESAKTITAPLPDISFASEPQATPSQTFETILGKRSAAKNGAGKFQVPITPKSSTKKSKETSATFKALRPTINDVKPMQQRQEPPRVKPFSLVPESKNRRIDPRTSGLHTNFDLASLFSSGTSSNTVSVVYDYNEIESIRNQLIHTLVDNCKHANFANIYQLGQLRLADELSVCTGETEIFFEKLVYLFEDHILVWNHHDYLEEPRLIPVNNVKISSKESVVHILQTTDDYPYVTMLQSPSSAIIEKWVVALSDRNLVIPAEVITNTIKSVTNNLNKRDQNPSISSSIHDVSTMDSDIDSDQERIDKIIQGDMLMYDREFL